MKLSFDTIEYKWITIPSHDTLMFHNEKSFVLSYASHTSHIVQLLLSHNSMEAEREVKYYREVRGSREYDTIF